MVARLVVLVAAVAVGIVGIVRGTWAVGGSDSSCYGLMAEAFASGVLQPASRLAVDAPWPNAPLTLAPGGFIPSPVRADAASPVCAPGFSLLLAPLRLIGGRDGIFFLTPAAGALLVWLTFVFGRRVAGPLVGAVSAVTVATMPVMLFQVVQPMNDVVVATLWMAILVAATAATPRPAIVGMLTGLAVLVRPNLAPAAVIIGLVSMGVPWRSPMRVVAFVAASAPFVAVALAMNYVLYGHALQSGYGSTSALFSVDHLLPNLRNYGSALFETQLAFPLVAIAALAVAPPAARRSVLLTLGVCASIVVLYLFYKPFPEWWYLRFLLPALAPLTVLAMCTVFWGTRSYRVVVAVALVVMGGGITAAVERRVFDVWQLESRFRTAGAVVRDRLPGNAAMITVWQSGSVKYHANREAILWDSLDGTALDNAVHWLLQQGLEPYIMVEQWEEPLFRERFAERSTFGDLDWPPRFDIERQVKVFKPSDRALYMQGGRVHTEYVRR